MYSWSLHYKTLQSLNLGVHTVHFVDFVIFVQQMHNVQIQRDSKRWTEFRTSIFPELYMVCG